MTYYSAPGRLGLAWLGLVCAWPALAWPGLACTLAAPLLPPCCNLLQPPAPTTPLLPPPLLQASAVAICTALFLSVALGSQIAFGAAHMPADVLTLFNAARLEPLVGPALARLFYVLVRVGFLMSIISIFPMQASMRGKRERRNQRGGASSRGCVG